MGILLYVLVVIGSALAAYFLGLLNGALYIPTDDDTVRRMLSVAELKPGDRLVDLGSGDGRLVIAAAKQGIEAKGYEINPILVWLSNRTIRKEGLQDLASVEWKDFWSADMSRYNIVMVFGIAHIMKRLERLLKKELQPGSRIVCNLFSFPTWQGARKEGVFVYRR